MTDIRVLLVDDHPIVRNGISNLLQNAPDIQVVGEAGNGQEAIDLVNKLSPDVVMLDIEMPVMNGMEVARHLKESHQPVNILVMSAHDNQDYVQTLFSYGVSGYLLKDELPAAIVDAIHGVVRGERGWISRKVTSQMAVCIKEESRYSTLLTKREREILKFIVNGKSNQEIALSVHISEKTVEKHTNSIYKKFGVLSRVEAAVIAVREGM